MTRWPTVFESRVWATPRAPLATAIPIIPTTRATSSPVFCSGIAWSSTARSRNGETMPSAAEIEDQREDEPAASGKAGTVAAAGGDRGARRRADVLSTARLGRRRRGRRCGPVSRTRSARNSRRSAALSGPSSSLSARLVASRAASRPGGLRRELDAVSAPVGWVGERPRARVPRAGRAAPRGCWAGSAAPRQVSLGDRPCASRWWRTANSGHRRPLSVRLRPSRQAEARARAEDQQAEPGDEGCIAGLGLGLERCVDGFM